MKRWIFASLIVPVFLWGHSAHLSAKAIEGPVDKTKPLLKVTFFDVWQGDSILIETPNGTVILVDAGQGASEYTTFDAGEQVVLPELKKKGIKKIDHLIMSHPHFDHIGGCVAILKNIFVGEVLDCGMAYTSEIYENVLMLIDEKKTPFRIVQARGFLKWDPALNIRILNPPTKLYEGTRSDPNNNSITIRVEFKEVSFFLCGDIEADAEYDITRSRYKLRSTFLKAPHHGGEYSSTDEFLAAVHPQCVVISVGKHNRFGHPSPRTIARYKDRRIKIYRTDFDGNIRVLTDGTHYEVTTEKRGNRQSGNR